MKNQQKHVQAVHSFLFKMLFLPIYEPIFEKPYTFHHSVFAIICFLCEKIFMYSWGNLSREETSMFLQHLHIFLSVYEKDYSHLYLAMTFIEHLFHEIRLLGPLKDFSISIVSAKKVKEKIEHWDAYGDIILLGIKDTWNKETGEFIISLEDLPGSAENYGYLCLEMSFDNDENPEKESFLFVCPSALPRCEINK